MDRYIDQPTTQTNRKVHWASIAAPISAIIISLILNYVPALGGPENADMLQNIEMLITGVVVMISTRYTGYYIRERNPNYHPPENRG